MFDLTLLGPQRWKPDLVTAFDRLSIRGSVAAITAGWQEREGENEELQQHLGRQVIDLKLHRRLEQVFVEDPELFNEHRARQDRLRALQRLYRYRLDFFMEPARELLRRKKESEALAAHQQAAVEALRRFDQEHLESIRRIHADFEARHQPHQRPAIQRQREEMQNILSQMSGLAIAGGHVAVLINRIRLFGIADLVRDLPIFAWSAGAMALGQRIVVFHDSPPQGAGNAEVLDVGLGWFSDLLPLPHASRRLHLDDPLRVGLFAQRFAPEIGVPLEMGTSLRFEKGAWHPWSDALGLAPDGQLKDFRGATHR